MFQKLEVLQMARAMAQHAGAQQQITARNVAHADTPGYKARELPGFAEIYRDGVASLRATRSRHLSGRPEVAVKLSPRVTSGQPAPNGNSVSLEAEMVTAAETRAQHDMALAIYRSLSSALRASLGRGR